MVLCAALFENVIVALFENDSFIRLLSCLDCTSLGARHSASIIDNLIKTQKGKKLVMIVPSSPTPKRASSSVLRKQIDNLSSPLGANRNFSLSAKRREILKRLRQRKQRL